MAAQLKKPLLRFMLPLCLIAALSLPLSAQDERVADQQPAETPAGLSISEHGYCNLYLEAGAWYSSHDVDQGDTVNTRSLLVPVIPGLGFSYLTKNNEFSWSFRGLVGYSTIDEFHQSEDGGGYLGDDPREGIMGGIAMLFAGHILKEDSVSFGFKTGVQADMFGREEFAPFIHDLYTDRTALHSFWAARSSSWGIKMPVHLFVLGNEGSFSVSVAADLLFFFMQGMSFPTTAQVSVRLLPDLDLRYDGGVVPTSFGGSPLAVWQMAGIGYHFSPQFEATLMAGYAGVPREWGNGDESPWRNDAALELALNFTNTGGTNKTVVGFRRLPLSGNGGWAYELVDDLFINFQDRSIRPWVLIGFDGDAAFAEGTRYEYKQPAMYLRFMPKLALTAWDIVTWQVTFGVIIKPLRAEHTDIDRDLQRFVESTITVAY